MKILICVENIRNVKVQWFRRSLHFYLEVSFNLMSPQMNLKVIFVLLFFVFIIFMTQNNYIIFLS